MTDKQPKGWMDKVLFIDCETTGLSFGDDPTYNSTTNETYQAIAWGLIVANAQTLDIIDKLYVEIKWDGESVWSKEAEKVHGLSLQYLEDNGLDEEDAVVEMAQFLIKYWGPTGVVCVGGHNVATFDLPFFRRQLRKYGLPVRFGARTIDCHAAGFAALETYNSDDLFAMVGLPARDPEHHNALVDADNARKAVRFIRRAFARCLDEQ